MTAPGIPVRSLGKQVIAEGAKAQTILSAMMHFVEAAKELERVHAHFTRAQDLDVQPHIGCPLNQIRLDEGDVGLFEAVILDGANSGKVMEIMLDIIRKESAPGEDKNRRKS